MNYVWVNYAKAVGIFLVVYGHVARGLKTANVSMDPSIFNLVDSVIYSFHMPLFFFLSGLFFLDSWEKRHSAGLLLNKVDTIVYPYILWSILHGAIEVIMARWTNGQTTLGDVFSLLWLPRAHFWFLYGLFFVFLAAVLSVQLLSTRRIFLMGALAVVLYLLRGDLSRIPALSYIANFLIYFWLGIYFKKLSPYISGNPGWLALFFGTIAVAVQFFLHTDAAPLSGVAMLLNPIAAMVSIAFICFSCIWLSQWKINWLTSLGLFSFVIYLAHVLAASGARIVLSKVFVVDDIYVHTFVGMCAGLGVPILLALIAGRWGLGALFSNPWPLEPSQTGQKISNAV